MTWKADSVVGVLFPIYGSPQLDAIDAWKDLSGGQNPDAFNRPPNFPIAPAQAQGTIGNLSATVASQSGRLEIRLAARNSALRPQEIEQITDISTACDCVRQALLTWTNKVKPARLAIVVELSERVPAHMTVQEKFQERVPVFTFPPGAIDLIYQYNERKDYESYPEAKMNRILTWSTGQMLLFNMPVGIGLSGLNAIPSFSQPSLSIDIVSWKIDINSATSVDISKFAGDMIAEHHDEALRLLRDAHSLVGEIQQ